MTPTSACQKTDGPDADPTTTAPRYARLLLRSLARDALAGSVAASGSAALHPAIAWARSGAMSLTGPEHGAPQLCPVPLAACADGVVLALRALAPDALPQDLRGSDLLGERAALSGLVRRGPVSPGGACRLLPSASGPVALNLPREQDWSLVPAWLETTDWDDAMPVPARWDALAAQVAIRDADSIVARGRLLGLAVAAAARPPPSESRWFGLMGPECRGPECRGPQSAGSRPRVLDLSALWAGPLCSDLLRQLGAEVIKVESTSRPDGAREGPRAFFDLLNGDKASVAIDFASERGQRDLLRLVSTADIVIEGSRPRALQQLGIVAEELVARRPGLTWISLTGHGRADPGGDWVAFGDDAAVDAGLSALIEEVTGDWLICGDAVADPLAGMHAALAAWADWKAGGGHLLSISLRQVAAFAAGFELPATPDARRTRYADWLAVLERSGESIAAPRARAARGLAAALGADTTRILGALPDEGPPRPGD